MYLSIEYCNNIDYKCLVYQEDEFSFLMEPYLNSYDYALTINRIFIPIDNYYIKQVSGVCGHHSWNLIELNLPLFRKGRIKINLPNYEIGSMKIFEIFDDNNQVFFDESKEWVCIGDPQKKGEAVEFISNCGMVLDENGNFLSLWLKPIVSTSWKKVFKENK